MVMANETIYVGTDRGLLQVDAPSGVISPCIIPGYNIKTMAVNEKGILYMIGGTGKVGIPGNYGLIMRTTTNSKPIISSFEADIERYEELRNKVWVDYRVKVKDPLGWNRNLIETINYGDGETRESKIYVRKSRTGKDRLERFEERNFGHSYNLDDLTDLEEGLTRPSYEVSVEGCEECSVSKITEVCLGAPKISKISVLPDDNVYLGEEVDFKGRAQPPICGNSELTYTWDFDDYSEKIRGSMVKHSFNRTGEFAVSLTVGIKGSLITTRFMRVINVSKTQLVEVERTPIKYSEDGLEYRFDYKLRGDLLDYKEPLEVLWNFGDGDTVTTAGKESVVHRFKTPGVYKVRAQVFFAEGITSVGKEYVYYEDLPAMTLSITPEKPYTYQPIDVLCSPKDPEALVEGLAYRFVIDNSSEEEREVLRSAPSLKELKFETPGTCPEILNQGGLWD